MTRGQPAKRFPARDCLIGGMGSPRWNGLGRGGTRLSFDKTGARWNNRAQPAPTNLESLPRMMARRPLALALAEASKPSAGRVGWPKGLPRTSYLNKTWGCGRATGPHSGHLG